MPPGPRPPYIKLIDTPPIVSLPCYKTSSYTAVECIFFFCVCNTWQVSVKSESMCHHKSTPNVCSIALVKYTHTQSCSDGMDELTGRLLSLFTELDQLQSQMAEFRSGLRQQVDSILSSHHAPSPPTGTLIDLNT